MWVNETEQEKFKCIMKRKKKQKTPNQFSAHDPLKYPGKLKIPIF